MADFSLKAVFGIDATGVKTELKKLRSDINDVAEDWAKIGMAAAATAFVALSKGALDLAEKLKDTALSVGINVEALQTLYYVAEQNGSSQEQMSKALEKARIGFQKAAEGSTAQSDAMRTLGINIEGVINLPLERKFQSLALAYVQAEDKGAAFNAISEILGEKIGPKLMATLTELGERGFPDVADSAAAAGHVMSAETIEALESAKQSIENFKKEATIAVGNILVNFRSEEGLKLLGLQLMKVLASFGGGIVDAIVEAGSMVKAILAGEFEWVVGKLRNGLLDAVAAVAGQINRILPEKFQINIGNLEELKVATDSLGTTIGNKIAQTSPSTFKKDFTAMWDDAITNQKKVVDAMNRVDFKDGSDNLRNAGEQFTKKVETRAAPAISDSGKQAAASIADAAVSIPKAVEPVKTLAKEIANMTGQILTTWKDMAGAQYSFLGARGGKDFNSADDRTLQEIIARNKRTISAATNPALNPTTYNDYVTRFETGRLQTEIANAERELEMRKKVRQAYARGGVEDVYRTLSDTDPLILERLVQQFAANLSESERTATTLDKLANGLKSKFGLTF